MDRPDHTEIPLGTARGSTSRAGPKRWANCCARSESKGVAFTLDGPRGPAEVAQFGAVWLAKATGNPLLPFHSEAASSWTLKSWDRTQIPKPFTTVAMVVGKPIYVPRDADDRVLDESRITLETALAAARTECRGSNLTCYLINSRPRSQFASRADQGDSAGLSFASPTP